MMPGLGLSNEIYKEYNFPNCHVTKLHWIHPEVKEPLDLYCRRLVHGKITEGQDLVMVGHSFGGVVVQELSKLIETRKVILISSIKSGKELPANFILVRRFHLYHLLSRSFIEKSFWSWGKTHGYDTVEIRKIFLDSIKKLENGYFRWATRSLVTLDHSPSDDPKIIHYHGNLDKTFPISKISKPIVIKGGDHLMVFKKSEILNKLILDSIEG